MIIASTIPEHIGSEAKLPAEGNETAELRRQVAQLQAQLLLESQQHVALREQLMQRQNYIEQLTQAVPAALYLYNLATEAEVFLNDRLFPMLDYPPEEIGALYPHLLAALLHPYDKRRLPMHHEKLRAAPAGTSVQMELRLRVGSGQWKWFRVQELVFSRDTEGNAEQLLGTIQDIQVEQVFWGQLKTQKEFYESILNSLPASIALFDESQTCLFVDQHGFTDSIENQAIIGHSYAAYCQLQPWEPAVATRHAQEFERVLSTKAEVGWEEVHTRPGQPENHYLRRFYPVLNPAGDVTCVVAYGEDITQRRQLEQQLAQQQALVQDGLRQQALVQQVIETVPSPICVHDESDRIILANEAYAQLHRLSRAELLAPLAPPAAEALPPDRPLPAASSSEEHFTAPDGAPAWYHTIRKPFARPDGSRYLLTIAADITGLNRAREVAEASVRAKELFLANMSHEIRTPMNGIVGLARLLKKDAATPEQTEYLNLILSNAESLLVVINDVLDFAKIESGKVEFESIPFDVAEAVNGAVKALSILAEAKGLLLQADVDDELLPVVEGDPVRLNQVLVNLVNNAIKFTGSGEVTVRAHVSRYEPDSGMVHLQFCVADTGIGISPDKFDQVFKSFGQAHTSTTRLYGGTGLGLAICKNLLDLQGGHIWVESEVGRGSRFYFTLPYPVSEQLPTVADAAPPLPAGLLRGLRVLLVEDNPVNLFLARALLHSWEVKADVAADGVEALACAATTAYNLILMDIQMPLLNGLEATAQLRHAPGRNQRTPVIALTANTLQSNLNAYSQGGFTGWLLKPYHEQSLYRAIACYSGRYEEADALPAPVPLAAPSAPAFGFEGLGRLAQDAGFVRKMQQLFVDTVPAQLGQLRAALTAQDWPTAHQLVHTLKSTYGNLQIAEAQRCLKRFEEILKKNPEPTALLMLLRTADRITAQIVDVFTIQLNK